ncbi:putative secreted protein [Rhodopirellula europaea 6C]|uniref:Putative secreted protein n=2 Tax=Rhodopirellula TaxID=265488 RepID=M2A7T9_9BACT|nr:putative secreted protein [Rhodopirellula europaea 6C]
MKMIRNVLLLMFTLLNSTFCLATDQVWDKVVVEGKQQYVREHPLAGYWTRENRPRFDPISTANWKGYTTRWEIRDSTLYLTSFDATIDGQPVDPESIFGEGKLPIPANWFTGKLTVLRRGFPVPFDKPHFASASLYLIERGKVCQMRYESRMRFELPQGRHEFTLKRESGQFIVSNPRSNVKEIPEVLTGDVVHGLIDRNGFSLNFTDESDELANALLRGDTGNEFTLFLSTPLRADGIRAVKIKREHPLRTKR